MPGAVVQAPMVQTPPMTIRDAIDLRAHLRGGQKGVAPLLHRGAARVRALSAKDDQWRCNAVGARARFRAADPHRAGRAPVRYGARGRRRRRGALCRFPLTRSKSIPGSASASTSEIPSLSFRPLASSKSRKPEHAEEPKRLRPNRAPSSSAQSTSRTVVGGLPAYRVLIWRRISTPARMFRQPSSQPPLGTESMWPPIRSA